MQHLASPGFPGIALSRKPHQECSRSRRQKNIMGAVLLFLCHLPLVDFQIMQTKPPPPPPSPLPPGRAAFLLALTSPSLSFSSMKR